MFLELNQIRKGFGVGEQRVEVLRDVTFSLAKGEIAVLLGVSGSGKSTLLNLIGGIDTPDHGSIRVQGEEMGENDSSLTAYRRKHLGFVFQSYHLIPNLTIQENIEIGAYLSENPLSVEDIIQALGLSDHRKKLPNQVSGGQQQRASIGRAMAKNPDLLLCDEPTGALDFVTSREILQLLKEMNQRYRTTMMIVTHDKSICSLGGRVLRLCEGHLVEEECGVAL